VGTQLVLVTEAASLRADGLSGELHVETWRLTGVAAQVGALTVETASLAPRADGIIEAPAPVVAQGPEGVRYQAERGTWDPASGAVELQAVTGTLKVDGVLEVHTGPAASFNQDSRVLTVAQGGAFQLGTDGATSTRLTPAAEPSAR
jgi:hypothetical protein